MKSFISNHKKQLSFSIFILFFAFILLFSLFFLKNPLFLLKNSTFSQKTFILKAQSSYPQCQQGRITSPCQCGNQIYNAGFCCYHPNANSGIWFDPSYEDILPNGCPTGNFYFVDQNNPNASDENFGTEELPWETIKHSGEVVMAGDVVLVKYGHYYSLSDERRVPSIKPLHSGQPESPIIFKAYPGHEAIIMSGPSLNTSPDQFTNPAIGTYHADYVVIDGFKIYGAISFCGGSLDIVEGCIVQNCEIWGGCPDREKIGPGTNHQGIRLEYTKDCIIRNNIIRDVNLYNHHNYAGIKVFNAINLLVEHNEIYNCSCGIFDKDSSVDNIYRFNVIHDCSNVGWLGPGQNRGLFSQNTKVYQNIFYECDDTYKLLNFVGQQNFQLFNNILYNSNSAIKALNGENHQFWNNIIVDTSNPYKQNYGTKPMSHSDYNCFYNYDYFSINWVSVGNLESWQFQTDFDQHSIEADPLFLNPTSHNFHLQPSSPCLNAGIDRQDYDNDGNTTESINMGAYITGNETIGLIDLSQYIVEEPQPNSCASQNGVCCNENQICQNGTFISSSDCGNLCCTGECVSPSVPGDLNQDNKVNSLDFQILIQKFKETQNIEIEDLNSDGIVDVKDIGILMHYWNE